MYPLILYLFQPLDVQGGPNGFAKRLMKKKISDWYAAQITNALDEGQELDSINIELKLSIIKPLHAQWIIELYNGMTSNKWKESWGSWAWSVKITKPWPM